MGPLETDQSTRGRELVELLEEVAPGFKHHLGLS